MNTIHFNKKYELRPNYYVIPFSCSDLVGINTEVSFRDRSESTQKALQKITDRIAKALYNQGYILESVNFSSMSISCNLSTLVSQR